MSTAERVARLAHEGQIEVLTGRPYIEHVERIVALVESPEAKEVAWLHDVLEDTPLTQRDLLKAGIPEAQVEAVVLLTRGEETYTEYIEVLRARKNRWAVEVKIADLRDHLREETLETLPASLRRRYERALARLITTPVFRPAPKWQKVIASSN